VKKKPGAKTEIQKLNDPALVQLLIRAAIQEAEYHKRKTELLVIRSATEILIRLGHDRKEAIRLTDKIMEQMQ
jgi:hypothetical protein